MSFSKIALSRWGLLLMFFSLSYLTSPAQVIWEEDWETYSLGIMDDSEPETKGWDARLGFGSGQWSVLSDGAGNQYLSRLNKANECCYWKGCRMLREETQAYDDVYYGFRFKFDSNFDFKSGGKLNGVIGGNDPSPGVPTDGASGSSVSLMWRKHPNGTDAYMHTYTYCENKDDQWGQRDTFKDANNNMIQIVRDQWYSVVVKIKMNTQNVPDGRITVYLDGQVVIDRNDYLFRSGSGTWGWDINQLIYFFGGNGPGWAPGTDSYVYEDDWVFSQSLPTHLMNGYNPPQAPVANLQVSATTGTSPLTVTLDASASTDSDGTITSYTWQFGDGSADVVTTSPTISHTYNNPGDYVAKVIVKDDDTHTSTKAVSIEVLQTVTGGPPVASLSVSATTGTAPLTVTFDGSASYDVGSGSIVAYRWKFGDISPVRIITDPQITHTYTTPGVYTANMEVIDNSGEKSKKYITITVLPANGATEGPPVANLSVSATTGTAPFSVTFDGSGSYDIGSGSIISYRWKFGDISPVKQGNLPQITHIYTVPGVYLANFEVMDNSGEKTKEYVSITVLPGNGPTQGPPVAELSVSSTTGTAPFSVSFDGSQSFDLGNGSILAYRWNFGDGSPVKMKSDPQITHIYTTPGVYAARLQVIDNDGFKDEKGITITVENPLPNEGPEAAMTMSATSGTVPFTVNFDASGSFDPDGSITTYKWRFGDGISSGDQASSQISYTYTSVGVFNGWMKVSDNDGKSAFQYFTVTVTPAPTGCDPMGDWTFSDIGPVGIAGEVCYSGDNGQFEISASGEDIWNNSDEFGYLYQPLDGDGELIMKLDYLENTHTYGKIGLMMRESLTPDSKHAMIVMNQTQRALQYRKTTSGNTLPNSGSWIGPTYSHPTWFKLQRFGDVFAAFLSGDGSSWIPVDTVHVSMGAGIYAGIALTSHNNTRINTSLVSNVSFSDYASGAVNPQFFGFEANEGPGGVVLTWSTGPELNSDYFTVESSIDGLFYQTLDRLDGAGTSVAYNEYRTVDPEPRVGLTYYRLSQTDFSGESAILATATFSSEAASVERITIYPNPVTDHRFTVVVDGLPADLTKDVRVLDTRGREIFVDKINEGELSVNLPADLPKGIYQVRVSYQGGILGETIIVR